MKKTILIAAVMFFAFSVAASAQALFQVGSTPVTAASSCGATELTGDIAFTQVSGSAPIQNGTITINYGVPIVPSGTAFYTVTDSTGATIVAPTAIAVASTVLSNQVTFTVGPPPSGVGPFTIRVFGVRVNVAGTGLTSLSATVSSTINLFVGGQTSVVVISAIKPTISSIDTNTDIFTNTAVSLNSVSPAVPKTVQLDVNEGFTNAFVQNQIIGLTFSAIPAGITLSLPATVTTIDNTGFNGVVGQVFQAVDADTGVAITGPVLSSTSTSLVVFYKLVTTTTLGVTTQEILRIPVTVNTIFGAPSPLPLGSVSVTADLYPKLPAFFPNYTLIPQYSGTSCQVGPVTVVTIVTGNTTLLIPYAVSSAGYDTGLAVANTTKDPLSVFQTAVPQNTTITFTFFPQATGGVVPDSFSYTTSATSPGTGLISGVLNSGSLYTVLLSQLLTAAGKPGDFSGYVFVVLKATNGHGQYFISDFEAFTNGALMLVVDPAARKTAPEKLDN